MSDGLGGVTEPSPGGREGRTWGGGGVASQVPPRPPPRIQPQTLETRCPASQPRLTGHFPAFRDVESLLSERPVPASPRPGDHWLPRIGYRLDSAGFGGRWGVGGPPSPPSCLSSPPRPRAEPTSWLPATLRDLELETVGLRPPSACFGPLRHFASLSLSFLICKVSPLERAGETVRGKGFVVC